MTGYDLLRAGARRSRARRDAVHHGHRGIQDRERDRGEEGGREQLHRQAVQRPDAQDQDRGGVRGRADSVRRARAIRLRSPRQPRADRFRRDARRRKDRVQRRQVRRLAPAQFLGMDAGDDEQAIEPERSGALEIGAHRIADRQHAREAASACRAAPRPWRARPRRSARTACRNTAPRRRARHRASAIAPAQ